MGFALRSPGPSVPVLPCVGLWGAGVLAALPCTVHVNHLFELGLVVSLPIVSTRTYLVLTLGFRWQEAQTA